MQNGQQDAGDEVRQQHMKQSPPQVLEKYERPGAAMPALEQIARNKHKTQYSGLQHHSQQPAPGGGNSAPDQIKHMIPDNLDDCHYPEQVHPDNSQ
ncbi:hypothetical protein SDC9_162028 [bioreactor metagenome]|uniref:Uncharacterized protein n=1 Tax=bioreactor metagenome TaxID=1076179 RepID=A0A645FK02_9ZZZZ